MTVTPAALLSVPTVAADAAYRAVSSLVSIAALVALATGAWPSPLAALAALPLPDKLLPLLAWVPEAATWTTAHSDATAAAGAGLLMLGLIAAAHEPIYALPADSRAGSSAALGLAALAQVDQLPQAAFMLAIFVAAAFAVRSVQGRGVDTSELVGTASLHLLGAVLLVPLALMSFAISRGAVATSEDGS